MFPGVFHCCLLTCFRTERMWMLTLMLLLFGISRGQLRDPTTLAVLLEDGGACVGVLMAMGGIG